MRVLITGAGGMLARAVQRVLLERGHDGVPLTRARLDVRDAGAVRAAILAERPAAVVHAAAYTRVDDAESDEAAAFAVNAGGAANVAAACAEAGARLVYPSTDYVFDGRAAAPYPVDAPPNPLNAYGRSKLEGERRVAATADALVIRTSWLYGAGGRNFVATILERASAGVPLRVVADQRGAPTWTQDLAVVVVRLLELHAPAGRYHATGGGVTTWFELAREALRLAGLPDHVVPVSSDELTRPARRPRNSVLDCSTTEALVGPMRPWREALAAALRVGVASDAPPGTPDLPPTSTAAARGP